MKEINKKPIVTRLLKRKNSNEQVEIKIYPPIQEDDDWSCSFIIGGKEEKVYGIDSMQSLILTLDTIRIRLNDNNNDLYWLDDLKFLGFPLFVPMYLPDNERDRIEATLEREVNKLLRE